MLLSVFGGVHLHNILNYVPALKTKAMHLLHGNSTKETLKWLMGNLVTCMVFLHLSSFMCKMSAEGMESLEVGVN